MIELACSIVKDCYATARGLIPVGIGLKTV